jgi:hypothetical protein
MGIIDNKIDRNFIDLSLIESFFIFHFSLLYTWGSVISKRVFRTELKLK